MELCRLCGCEKSSEDLVIALSEEIQIITFREFVEFYCRISLDASKNLPQRVCRSCKMNVVNFSEFSYLVEKQQEKFDIKPNIAEIFIEPEVKKQKIEETTNINNEMKLDTADSEVPVKNADEASVLFFEVVENKAETENPKPMSRLRERRKSVLFLQSIESLLANDKVSCLDFTSSDCVTNLIFSLDNRQKLGRS